MKINEDFSQPLNNNRPLFGQKLKVPFQLEPTCLVGEFLPISHPKDGATGG